jgi:hypothetical protein
MPIDHCYAIANFSNVKRFSFFGEKGVATTYASTRVVTDAKGMAVLPDQRPPWLSRYAGESITLSCPEYEIAYIDLSWKPGTLFPDAERAAAQKANPLREPFGLHVHVRPRSTAPLPHRTAETLLSARYCRGSLVGRCQFSEEP